MGLQRDRDAAIYACDPECFKAFERLLAQPDPPEMPRRAHVYSCDGEPERRPTYTRLVRDGVLPPGYAADDDAAFHFEGTGLREVVSQREGARGYRIGVDGEQPLDARSL